VEEFVSRPFLLVRRKKAIIMRNITFSELQKRLEEIFSSSGAAVMLYEAGRACGERSAERLASQLGVRNEALLSAIIKVKRAEGWGAIEFKDTLLGEINQVIVKHSFEAMEYGRSQVPVCHFLRGYLVGVLSIALNLKASLTEIKCLSMGDEYCEFQSKRN